MKTKEINNNNSSNNNDNSDIAEVEHNPEAAVHAMFARSSDALQLNLNRTPFKRITTN